MSAQNTKKVKKSAPTYEHAVRIRRSKLHGRGMFVTQSIPRGAQIMEYCGQIISWVEAQTRHPHDPKQPHHTFYFHINDERVIDGTFGGNDAKWINHSCAPNAEARERRGRIFIHALRDLAVGEEVTYDYGLTIDEPYSEALIRDYRCLCGAENCTGTLLHFSDEPDDDAAS